MHERYAARRAAFEASFRTASPDEATRRRYTSPSGNFSLDTAEYAVPSSNWRYSRGVVSAVNDEVVIADVHRNYLQFWHTWAHHANGREYLLCGEDYQGQTIVDLTRRRTTTYFPDAGFSGAGFCWVAAYPSPDCTLLAIDGCYWACPYEIVVVDFREPESLPYAEIARFPGAWEWKGWIDSATLEYVVSVDVRKTDNVPYDSLPETEQAQLDQDWRLIETVHQLRRFTIP